MGTEEAPETALPVAAAFDREEIRQQVSDVIEKAWWSPGTPASVKVMEVIWPLLERAGAAERKLAEIEALCHTGLPHDPLVLVNVDEILAIIGGEEDGPDPLGDLRAELGEARSESQMIRDHASRYLQAAYGPSYVYRAPETFGNLVERWIWAVAAGTPETAHACIADIERRCAERDACQCGSEGEECRG